MQPKHLVAILAMGLPFAFTSPIRMVTFSYRLYDIVCWYLVKRPKKARPFLTIPSVTMMPKPFPTIQSVTMMPKPFPTIQSATMMLRPFPTIQSATMMPKPFPTIQSVTMMPRPFLTILKHEEACRHRQVLTRNHDWMPQKLKIRPYQPFSLILYSQYCFVCFICFQRSCQRSRNSIMGSL